MPDIATSTELSEKLRRSVLRPLAVGVEAGAWNEGDFFLCDGTAQQILGVEPLGQRHPDEHAALRPRPAASCGKEFVKCTEHGVAARTVGPPYRREMVGRDGRGDLVQDHLVERAAVEIARLLDDDELVDDRRGAAIQPMRSPGAIVFEKVPQ